MLNNVKSLEKFDKYENYMYNYVWFYVLIFIKMIDIKKLNDPDGLSEMDDVIWETSKAVNSLKSEINSISRVEVGKKGVSTINEKLKDVHNDIKKLAADKLNANP